MWKNYSIGIKELINLIFLILFEVFDVIMWRWKIRFLMKSSCKFYIIKELAALDSTD